MAAAGVGSETAMRVRIESVTKRYGGKAVVDGVSLGVQDGELVFLLGPSGSGKTTLLRMVAGFIDPDEGRIVFGDRPMNGVPPHKRNTALVFQHYAVWPHMSVFENIAYGLRVRGVDRTELERRVDEAIAKVRLGGLERRRPGHLSGGEQQRVALARAIIVRPDILLFDEPLSNLDAGLRLEMRDEIKRLFQEGSLTGIYVTHDQTEALSVADRIAVMRGGRIEQMGTPREVYDRPTNEFVAEFVGDINLFGGDCALGAALGVPAGKRFGFRPERVRLGGDGVAANVMGTTFVGSRYDVMLEVGGACLKAWHDGPLAPGDHMVFSVPPQHILVFG